MVNEPFCEALSGRSVSVILAKVLSGRGFDVLTAKDADMLRKSDEEQLLFGTKHSRAILTTVAISRSYTQAPVCRTSTSRVAVPAARDWSTMQVTLDQVGVHKQGNDGA